MQPLVAQVAHLLGGVVLALGFALLTCRRFAAMLSVVRLQSLGVAVAAGWQAWASGSAMPGALGLVALLGGMTALRQPAGSVADDAPSVPVALTAAAASVALAVLAALPAHLPNLPPIREDLALGLSTVLVALLALASRRMATAQLVALQSLANAVALVAVIAGAEAEAVLAVAVLFGIVAFGRVVLP